MCRYRSHSKIATSQLALPQDACARVYATQGYETSVGNFDRTSLARHMVFRDAGGASQLATTSGGPATGYTATLPVVI